MPQLNKLQAKSEVTVLVVNNGDLEATRKWAVDLQARFLVLVQEKFILSKRYEVFATPFAFLINERGVVASTRRHSWNGARHDDHETHVPS
jgi:peroxiredoxin